MVAGIYLVHTLGWAVCWSSLSPQNNQEGRSHGMPYTQKHKGTGHPLSSLLFSCFGFLPPPLLSTCMHAKPPSKDLVRLRPTERQGSVIFVTLFSIFRAPVPTTAHFSNSSGSSRHCSYRALGLRANPGQLSVCRPGSSGLVTFSRSVLGVQVDVCANQVFLPAVVVESTSEISGFGEAKM